MAPRCATGGVDGTLRLSGRHLRRKLMNVEFKVMAISAHPADFCSRSGGTLMRHAQMGARVKVVWLTSGETEESGALLEQRPGISVESAARRRGTM